LLEHLVSPACNVVDHADEWLKILGSFLEKGAYHTELEQVMEQLQSVFETAGDDRLRQFLSITQGDTFGISSTASESFSLFDDPKVDLSE
jgi:hypothetical protein